jgi:prepilin-type N-terminal cleavage/methylation domain-containing protein
MNRSFHDARGFTLVEVIVTIIVTAILSAIFINFMGTAMSRSVRSIEMARGEAGGEAALERIISDYVIRINQYTNAADPEPLAQMKTAIDAQAYGSEVSATYITFDGSGNQVVSGTATRTLRVTVAASGNDLVALLTKSRSPDSPPVPF